MKTRLLIIIGIILTSIIFGTYQSIMYQCGTMPVFVETPRNPTLWKCLDMWKHQSSQQSLPTEPEPKTQENKDSVYSLPYGMTTEDIENMVHMEPIYRMNPNNSEELILDIDAMQQVQRILNKCDYVQKLRSGEIPEQNPDGSYNAVTSELRYYHNGTHYIDSNICKWADSLELLAYHCFEANPVEQNWYFGPDYFDNGTHHLDRQYCDWEIKNEN